MRKLQMFSGEFHAVGEYGETVPFGPVVVSGPSRVLQIAYMPFRMRHQPEYASRSVADTGDTLDGAVGIIWVGPSLSLCVGIFEYDHPVLFQMIQYLLVLRYELPFSVSNGQIDDLRQVLRPNAFGPWPLQIYPPVFKSSLSLIHI